EYAMQTRTRNLVPSDEFVVFGLGEHGRKCEDLRVLVQLRLPSPRDCGEGRRRVEDGYGGPDADREGFRAVGPHARFRTQLRTDRSQVRDRLVELGSRIRVCPIPTDRREDPEEMAECAARWQSGRDIVYRKVVLLREIRQPSTI